jgi:predicted transcriptional regulator
MSYMKRTTMFLDAALEQDLRRYAEQQDRSVASVVREALTLWVDAQRARPAVRPAFVAVGRSGHADTAERHESIVFAELDPHGAAVKAPRTRSRPGSRGAERRTTRTSSR